MTSLGLILLVIGAVVAVAEAHYPTQGIAGGTGVLLIAVGAVLIPVKPLRPRTRYTASVSVQDRSGTLSRQWRFTTR